MKLPLIATALCTTISTLGACNINPTTPEQAAKDWAATLHLPVDGVACTGADTDGDGYVTCSVSIHGDNPRIESVQCAQIGSMFARGCKLTAVKVAKGSR